MSTSRQRRVVVTGMGLVTCLGVGVNTVWSRLLEGRCGLGKVEGKGYDQIPCQVVGRVPCGEGSDEFSLQRVLSKSGDRGVTLAAAFALAAAEEALTMAGWKPDSERERERTGVCIGSGMVALEEIVAAGQELRGGGYRKVSPWFMPQILLNIAAGHVSLLYGLKGPNHCVSTACTTGAHSIGDACRFIQHGDADVMLAGGTEGCVGPLAMAGFSRMRALCTRFNHRPEQASRPFDAQREGFVMSEGAGLMVLEDLAHAQQRGAAILGEVYKLCARHGCGIGVRAVRVLGYGLSGVRVRAVLGYGLSGVGVRAVRSWGMGCAGVGVRAVQVLGYGLSGCQVLGYWLSGVGVRAVQVLGYGLSGVRVRAVFGYGLSGVGVRAVRCWGTGCQVLGYWLCRCWGTGCEVLGYGLCRCWGTGCAGVGVWAVQVLGYGLCRCWGTGCAGVGVEAVQVLGYGLSDVGVRAVQVLGYGLSGVGVRAVRCWGTGCQVLGYWLCRCWGTGCAGVGVRAVQVLGYGLCRCWGMGCAGVGVWAVQVLGYWLCRCWGRGCAGVEVHAVQVLGYGLSGVGVRAVMCWGTGCAGVGVRAVQVLGYGLSGVGVLAVQVLGYGLSGEATHLTAPSQSGSGARRCMAAAMTDGGLVEGGVGHVNAHATSTPIGDAAESRAIQDLLGSGALVTSIKGSMGHLLGAAGSVEAIVTLRSCQTGLVPPTLNLLHPDTACDLDYVTGSPRPWQAGNQGRRIALTNSFGFGGTNASLCLAEWL
ncbi:hypothetical protein ACOMHN_023517 [Nucella lapillus]